MIWILFILLTIPLFSHTWTLVWEDHFQGSKINENNWVFEIGNVGGNNEMVYYTNRTDNCFVSDGNLHLRAVKENYGGQPYTSCRMVTRYKHTWQHGRFEATLLLHFLCNIKLPKGRGLLFLFLIQ